jgi:hypothetical protein
MDNEYYPEESELSLIEKWDTSDIINLLSFIEDRWWCKDWGFIKSWDKDLIHGKPIIKLELHTGGWSGNESIIYALLKNWMFKTMWYSQWNRGGHYRFEINPCQIGYKTANEIAKEKGITRQAIHKSKKYDRIQVSDRLILFRDKQSRLEKPSA